MFIGSDTLASAAGPPNSFSITDIASYADEPQNTFSTRRITLITTSNTNLVPAGTTTTYINWPFTGGDTIVVSGVMTRDYALEVIVDWISLDPQPNGIYQTQLIYGFESYNSNGEYSVIQAITAKPNIVQDWNYWLNLGRVQTEISNSVQAVYYQQQESAQWAMNRAANILQNQLTNF